MFKTFLTAKAAKSAKGRKIKIKHHQKNTNSQPIFDKCSF